MPRTPPARRRRSAAETSRERILAAALELLSRYGYEGMSLQLLADRVGLHKSTLFHHFSSKQEVARAVLTSVIGPILETVRSLEVVKPPRAEDFVRVGGTLVDHFAKRPGTALFLLRSLIGPGDDFYEVRFDRTDDPVAELFRVLGDALRRGREAGTLRSLSVRHAIVNLLGVILCYPALVDTNQEVLPFPGAGAPQMLEARKRELAVLLERALAP